MGGWWNVPGILVLALVVGGVGGAYSGALAPSVGFSTFSSGVLLAALSALGLGGAAALGSALGRSWRGAAVRGAAIPLIVMLAVVLPNLGSIGGHPIHDVTTDLDDGVQFAPDVASLRVDAPRAEVLEIQREIYPDIAPLVVTAPPDTTFEQARQAAERMPGWTLGAVDERQGRIEALATTALFHFQDDVVIQVQPEGTGSRVDVRSRSRFGQSDLGANAARIRAFLAALEARL